MPWDVFISHAAEDKQEVVDPLCDLLRAAGVTVWLDTDELRPGSMILEKIDQGLSESCLAVVILSPAFFAKNWPRQELNALVASRKKIIPVWHRVDHAYVERHSPILAGVLAVSTQEGLATVASRIVQAIRSDTPAPRPRPPIHRDGRLGLALIVLGSLLALFVGGIFWSLLCKLFELPYLQGGSGNEPRGAWAFIWGLITLLPVAAGALMTYSGWAFFHTRQLPAAFVKTWSIVAILYGFAGGLGGVVFYTAGGRSSIESAKMAYQGQEVVIAVLWSLILSTSTAISLLSLYWTRARFPRLWRILFQVPFAVLLTGVVVTLFLLLTEPPSKSDQAKGAVVTEYSAKFDQERGVVAGVALRVGLFVALLAAMRLSEKSAARATAAS